jgi:hypothetical protein
MINTKERKRKVVVWALPSFSFVGFSSFLLLLKPKRNVGVRGLRIRSSVRSVEASSPQRWNQNQTRLNPLERFSIGSCLFASISLATQENPARNAPT